MSFFSCPIQAKSDPSKPLSVLQQQRINSRKTDPVTDKTKPITSLGHVVDDFVKLTVYCWLSAGKTYLVDTTVFSFAEHSFYDVKRQIPSRGMSLFKTMPAAQVASI